jgi:hypothetical protein
MSMAQPARARSAMRSMDNQSERPRGWAVGMWATRVAIKAAQLTHGHGKGKGLLLGLSYGRIGLPRVCI